MTPEGIGRTVKVLARGDEEDGLSVKVEEGDWVGR